MRGLQVDVTFMTDAQARLTTGTENRSYGSTEQGEDCPLLPSHKAINVEQFILAYIQ